MAAEPRLGEQSFNSSAWQSHGIAAAPQKIIMASPTIEPVTISYFLILLAQSPIFSKYSPVLLPCINPASTDGCNEYPRLNRVMAAFTNFQTLFTALVEYQ
jgi:hypothetical protein